MFLIRCCVSDVFFYCRSVFKYALSFSIYSCLFSSVVFLDSLFSILIRCFVFFFVNCVCTSGLAGDYN